MGEVMTYKQLADELGVSKDKIKYYAKKVGNDNKHVVDNVTYLTPKGVSKIKGFLEGKLSSTSPSVKPDIITHLEKLTEAINENNSLMREFIQSQKLLKAPKPPPKKKQLLSTWQIVLAILIMLFITLFIFYLSKTTPTQLSAF